MGAFQVIPYRRSTEWVLDDDIQLEDRTAYGLCYSYLDVELQVLQLVVEELLRR